MATALPCNLSIKMRNLCSKILLLSFLLFSASAGASREGLQQHGESLVGLRSPGITGKRLNILICSFQVAGHLMPLISLGQELQMRGHNVTVAAQAIEGDRNPERVVKESGLQFFQAGLFHMTKHDLETLLEDLAKNPVNLLAGFRMFARLEVELYEELDPLFGTQKRGFGDVDILIADGMTETAVWLAHKHGLPVVINDPHSFAVKQPPSLTYPNFPSGFDARMPFLKRIGNSVFYLVGRGLNAYKDSQVRKLVKERGIVEPPGYKFLSATVGARYIAEPVLVNTVPGLDFPTETGPNQFFVGPLVSSTIQPVPDDITAWLAARQSNQDPTIFVSFGSSAHMDVTQGQTFVRGLIDSGVHAIWPCRPTNRGFFKGIDLPDRIRIEEWVPQQAILNHSAVSGYAGHCGTGGTHQTLAFGKPVLCIPFMADHFETAARLRASGAGRTVDLAVLTKGDSRTVTEAIQSITSKDSPYRRASERVAGIMKAHGGVKTAANVIEYIAEFGYDHLKIARWELNWGARQSLDVLAFWAAVSSGFLMLGYFAACRLLAALRSGTKQKAA